MARPLKYHLDESITHFPALADALRRAEIDVTTPLDVDLRTAPDESHFEFAKREQRVLVTYDIDYIALGQADLTHPGVLYCHQRKFTLGQMIENLTLYWSVYDADDLHGKVEYL